MPVENVSDRNTIRSQFPPLNVLDAAGIALSPGSIVISTFATVLLGMSGWLVDRVFPVHSLQSPPSTFVTSLGIEHAVDGFVSGPWSSVTKPAILFLTANTGLTLRIKRFVQFCLALGIWTLAGVAVCRRSAHLFNSNDESTVLRAVSYSLRRWTVTIRSPLIPLAAAFLIGGLITCIGSLGALPVWGPTWLFLISPIVAVLGFAVAFLLLATMIAWPMMVAAISIDDCESFGGLSRAYSMLTGRPWFSVTCALLGSLVSILLLLATLVVAETTIWCGTSVTAFGVSGDQVRLSLLPHVSLIVHQIAAGIGGSYFWSLSTVIYLILRQEVDRVPLERMAQDDELRPVRDPLPVVGIPATDAKPEVNGEVLPIADRVE